MRSIASKAVHAHHILYKSWGNAKDGPKLVGVGTKILKKYGIGIHDIENLTWAPNIKGQHTTQNLRDVVSALWKADRQSGTRGAIVDELARQGLIAAGRR